MAACLRSKGRLLSARLKPTVVTAAPVRVTEFIELWRRTFGSVAPSSRAMIRYASGIHRSAPRWSDESKCQILPRVNMLWPS